MSHYDAIVIGAGHNGLTTANYLAKGGMNVCVLEQRPVVGGAAVTEEFCPGYRNSTFSYVVSLLRPEVIRDLQLADYGYEAITLENALYIDSTGDHLLLTADEQFNRSQFEKFSRTDFQAYEAFEHSVDEIGQLLAKQWLSEPPKLGEQGVGDLLAMLKKGGPAPNGRFAELTLLQSARTYPARHQSIMLAFDAACEAAKSASSVRTVTPQTG